VERGWVFLQALQLSTANTILSLLHTVLLMYLRRCIMLTVEGVVNQNT
jgi:hypothetical protein